MITPLLAPETLKPIIVITVLIIAILVMALPGWFNAIRNKFRK